MNAEFLQGAEHGRTPGPIRPQIQRQARLMTEMAVNPRVAAENSGLTYPYPGKGVSGETTN